MKKIVTFGLAFAVAFSGICFSPVANKEVKAADEWNLVWSDEFNGTSLDTNTWSYEIGNGNWGWGNGEVQYYTNRTDNVNVTGGSLQIIAKREDYRGYKYTSGRLITKNKKTFQYGYMEAKIKVENGNQKGVWPAFWMMGNNIDSVGWPRCGEIDIMEHANSNNYIGGCLHWGENNTTEHKYYSSGDSGDSYNNYFFSDNTNNGINGWHTYGILWNEDYIEWYVDGNMYFKQKLTSNKAYCVQQPHFFLLNLAIGGTGTGFTGYQTADENTYKTATMFVDYVRVYKNDAITEPETTTKYDGPMVTVTQDAIQDYEGDWTTFFSTSTGWTATSGTVTKGATFADGYTVDLTSAGVINNDSVWGAQVNLEGINYYPGATYKYKCTLVSDVDKKVYVKVADDGENTLCGGFVDLKAGVPYNFEQDCVIPEDYDGKLSLKFGFGKTDGDSIGDNSPVSVTVSNLSFVTTTEIPDPNYVPETTTVAPTTNNNGTTTVAPTTKKTIKKPARAKIKKLKNIKKRKLKVIIKKVKGAKGYQVRWSDSKNFNGYWQKNIKGRKYTIKKLDKKTRYYVKVRAFKLNGKKKVYGKWSKVKRLKIKK